jgi:hypothetical protein
MDVPEPTPLDYLVSKHGQKTVNTERLPYQLKQSKFDPPPTLDDLQREIGRLRHEVAFHHESHRSMLRLFNDARDIYRQLQQALQLASQQNELSDAFILVSSATQKAAATIQSSLSCVSDRLAACEAQFLLSLNIPLDDTKRNDYSIL